MPESRIEQFEAFLSRDNLRLTRERRLVAETVFALAGPFDFEIVLSALRNTSPTHRVTRPTVYRTLSLLEQSGLVRLN